MVFVARQGKVSAEEFFAMTWLPRIAELIDGEVVVNSPSLRHQRVRDELLYRLLNWAKASPGRGIVSTTVDVKLDGGNVYCPDLFWFSEDRVPHIDDVRLPRLPDLAAEVLSPSTRSNDLGKKRIRYEQHGLPEMWLIDPRPGANPVVRVFRRPEPGVPAFDLNLTLRVGDVLGSPQLEGFSVKVRDLVP
jgi:Uma2 family endonuclease